MSIKSKQENHKIQRAVLLGALKILKANYDERLDEYCIDFAVNQSNSMFSISLLKAESYIKCFTVNYNLSKGIFSLFYHPEDESDIERFNDDVDQVLSEIFDHVKGEK